MKLSYEDITEVLDELRAATKREEKREILENLVNPKDVELPNSFKSLVRSTDEGCVDTLLHNEDENCRKHNLLLVVTAVVENQLRRAKCSLQMLCLDPTPGIHKEYTITVAQELEQFLLRLKSADTYDKKLNVFETLINLDNQEILDAPDLHTSTVHADFIQHISREEDEFDDRFCVNIVKLFLASIERDLDWIKYLILTAHADMGSYMAEALKRKYYRATLFMIEQGADVNSLSQEERGKLLLTASSIGQITSLIKAVRSDYALCVFVLIRAGADVNIATSKGNTALMFSSSKIMESLLKAGANVNAANMFGKTALMHTTCPPEDDIKCIKLLIAAGADVDVTDRNGFTALIGASLDGKVEKVKLLIQAGADVNKKTHNGASAMIIATIYDHLECVKLLLEAGADVNSVDSSGQTALMIASQIGSIGVVNKLLQTRADVNMVDTDGNTALIRAVQYDRKECVKPLIFAGADVNISTAEGNTALMNANLENLKILLTSGADVNATNAQGNSALACKMDMGYSDFVITGTLLRNGADTSIADKKGETALIKAARHGSLMCVDGLIKAGAEVNVAANNGCTALMAAAVEGNSDSAERLVAAGASVNATDCNSETALMKAATIGALSVMECLIQGEAYVNLTDDHEEGAITRAVIHGDTQCTELLIDAEAELITAMPLIAAAWNGNAEVMELLLNAGADVNSTDKEGNTALLRTVENGHIECAKLLIEAGSDVDHVNKNRDTALILAARQGRTELVLFLLEEEAKPGETNVYGYNALTCHLAQCPIFNFELATLLINVGEVLYVADPMKRGVDQVNLTVADFKWNGDFTYVPVSRCIMSNQLFRTEIWSPPNCPQTGNSIVVKQEFGGADVNTTAANAFDIKAPDVKGPDLTASLTTVIKTEPEPNLNTETRNVLSTQVPSSGSCHSDSVSAGQSITEVVPKRTLKRSHSQTESDVQLHQCPSDVGERKRCKTCRALRELSTCT